MLTEGQPVSQWSDRNISGYFQSTDQVSPYRTNSSVYYALKTVYIHSNLLFNHWELKYLTLQFYGEVEFTVARKTCSWSNELNCLILYISITAATIMQDILTAAFTDCNITMYCTLLLQILEEFHDCFSFLVQVKFNSTFSLITLKLRINCKKLNSI